MQQSEHDSTYGSGDRRELTITAVVLNLPTTGPLLIDALLSQDMFLAGSFIMLLSILTVIGTLVSDLLLIVVDPRIRFEGRA